MSIDVPLDACFAASSSSNGDTVSRTVMSRRRIAAVAMSSEASVVEEETESRLKQLLNFPIEFFWMKVDVVNYLSRVFRAKVCDVARACVIIFRMMIRDCGDLCVIRSLLLERRAC